jgi:DNA-binding NtrC family response regulator
MLTPTTILLAEDDDHIRGLLSQVLTRRGYQVLEAADGSQALALYGSRRGGVDLLLSDVCMPGMTGVELALELRRVQQDLPVLLMSGYIVEVVGKFDFIPKPFMLPVLLDKVERNLNSRQRPQP